ncbi:rhodanese-like domain-containing protein [Thiosulfativibrio zosterae]|uniref:Rhodanese-like domain-containing protein n=1 Tax=Thiosulfativibrio zosterae TaxID=2675053 RepID=A0A6F8PK89_9GAMM|nr:rhodanese-like domain-containing protein [Thiosulfativibrio zosterae]BBP42496.1 rhodanese-like domain-containing protein [Thiosulfativibrio zosterae]
MFIEFVEQQALLFIALAVVTAMLIYSYVGDKLAGYESVGADEAVRLYNQDALVLDVRTEAEYRGGFIGEAQNISSSEIAAKIGSLSSRKADPVLVYCQSGARSAGVAKLLVKNGFQKVYNLSGGIMTWKSAGLPTNTPRSLRKQKNEKK